MAILFRVLFAVALLAPFMAAQGFRAPWWQVFIAALVAFAAGRLTWALVRQRRAGLATGLAGTAAALSIAGVLAWSLTDARRAGPRLDAYLEVDEVVAQSARRTDERLRVHGFVEPGSLKVGPKGRQRFTLMARRGAARLIVEHAGALPDDFRDGMDVVAEGRLGGAELVLAADRLMLKCPDTYDRGKGAKPF